MMGLLIELFKEIGQDLGKLIVRGVKALHPAARLLLLCLFVLAVLCLFYQNEVLQVARSGRRLSMAALDSKAIPLRGQDRIELDRLINILGNFLYMGYSQHFEKNEPRYGPWDSAQVAVALSGLNLPERKPINGSKIIDYFQRTRSDNCGARGLACWKEWQKESAQRANIGITAWVIFAKARLGVAAEEAEIRFLLAQQHPRDYSWPMLPCAQPGFGSTYATSWVLMALGEQSTRGLLHDPLLPEVNNAIKSGLSWLESNRRPEDGLWSSYPSKKWAGDVSVSNSGLAIHVVGLLEVDPLPELKRKWMGALRGRRGYVLEAETFNSWGCQGSQERDATNYMVLPWQLIATVDSYSEGSVVDRARAIGLVESVVSNKDGLLAELSQEDFVAAELLIALRHLKEAILTRGIKEVSAGENP